MPLTIYSDGGARGNPGPSAFAVVVCRNGKIIHRHSEFIGINTNNVAEYRGLIYAAGYAVDSKENEVEFVMDSELVIKQMNGKYKVRSKNLIQMHNDVRAMASAIPSVKFTHVRRSDPMIATADALLNDRMDEHAHSGTISSEK
ncbi:MAG: ribonuclease HI family protein [Methanomassiliicoccaceae archaeon]|nr:ribonuclease HI family protein [Methanomassiliicoccaceae archaeon]